MRVGEVIGFVVVVAIEFWGRRVISILVDGRFFRDVVLVISIN